MSLNASRPPSRSGPLPRAWIQPAQSAADVAAARCIFEEYGQSLNVDLCFQSFDAELATLPGEYAAPRGALLLARVAADEAEASGADAAIGDAPSFDHLPVAGCCALRPLDTTDWVNAAEMKRLYVRPAFRGLGLGRQLAEAALEQARNAGYSCVLLDTLSDMEAARAMYEELGFTEIPPYYHNPIAGAHYLKVDL